MTGMGARAVPINDLLWCSVLFRSRHPYYISFAPCMALHPLSFVWLHPVSLAVVC